MLRTFHETAASVLSPRCDAATCISARQIWCHNLASMSRSTAAAASASGAMTPTASGAPSLSARLSSYKPTTVSGSSTALLPARDSLSSMLVTGGARKQARAEQDAADEADEEREAEQQRKRQKMSLSEELAAAASGGAAQPAQHTSSSSHPPLSIQITRSASLGDLAVFGGAGADHGMAFDPDDGEEDDFFESIDPGSRRLAAAAGGRTPSFMFPNAAAAASANGFSGSAAAAAAAAAAADESLFAALTFPDPPLDWNLHSRIRFTSAHPFSWVSAPDLASEAEGMATFSSASKSDACSCLSVSPLRELHHALAYAIFPANPFAKHNPLTAAIRSALNKPMETRTPMDKMSLAFLRKTWIQWFEPAAAVLRASKSLPPAAAFI